MIVRIFGIFILIIQVLFFFYFGFLYIFLYLYHIYSICATIGFSFWNQYNHENLKSKLNQSELEIWYYGRARETSDDSIMKKLNINFIKFAMFFILTENNNINK